MGQKVHPNSLRVGVIRDWDTRWYASKKDFAGLLKEDYVVRTFVKKKLYAAGISRIEIERTVTKLTVGIFTAKPGIVIGKSGAGVESLKAELRAMTGRQVSINIYEIFNPDTDAQLIAENVAEQLVRRTSFRRAMKMCVQRAMKNGAKGIKTMVSGRLGGADIARKEQYHEGSIPLQTFRANIEFGFAEADTTYGKIGCKVWINKGEILPGSGMVRTSELLSKEQRPRRRRNDNRGRRNDNRNRNSRPGSRQEGGR